MTYEKKRNIIIICFLIWYIPLLRALIMVYEVDLYATNLSEYLPHPIITLGIIPVIVICMEVLVYKYKMLQSVTEKNKYLNICISITFTLYILYLLAFL